MFDLEKGQRRSRFNTIYDILRLCAKGLKKTHILYRANLSHQQLNKYLAALLKYDLLEAGENEFRTTGKGLLFIERFEELLKLVNEPPQ